VIVSGLHLIELEEPFWAIARSAVAYSMRAIYDSNISGVRFSANVSSSASQSIPLSAHVLGGKYPQNCIAIIIPIVIIDNISKFV
jgi:hypothetical protein